VIEGVINLKDSKDRLTQNGQIKIVAFIVVLVYGKIYD